MVSPTVAPVPESVGVVSSVLAPLATGPCTVPTSSATSPMAGAEGGVVSMVRPKLVLPVVPAALRASTV